MKNPLPSPLGESWPALVLVSGLVALGTPSLLGCTRDKDRSEATSSTRSIESSDQGAIHGLAVVTVAGEEGSRSIAVPDLRVYARTIDSGRQSEVVDTDVNGRFFIPPQVNGTYVICWEGSGFGEGCADESVTVEGQTAYVPMLVVPAPTPVVFGSVTLADGTNPNLQQPFFEAVIEAQVTAYDFTGAPVAGPVRTNGNGDYVLVGVPTTAAILHARSEEAAFETQLPPWSGEVTRIDASLPNLSPVIQQIVAYEGEQAVRHVPPGTTVEVRVEATDEDVLSFQWGVSGSEGGFTSENAPRVTWALPAVEGRHSIYVLVRDGRGGSAYGKLDITTGPPQAYFIGQVVDDDTGSPIPGALVTVDGLSTETDEEGGFILDAEASRSRYVLTISKDGYQLFSRVLTENITSDTYRLIQAYRTVIDPLTSTTVIEERANGKPGAELDFEPDSLVDPLGNPADRPLNVFISTVDPEDPRGQMPGNMGAINAAGEEVGLVTFGAVDVRIRDEEGTPYNVAPGRTVRVRIPVDPSLRDGRVELPGETPLWYYDEASGFWREEEGSSTWFTGEYYELDAPHFSVLNADIQFVNPACMRVFIDTTKVPLPAKVRVTTTTIANSVATFTFTADSSLNMIAYLAPNKNVTLELLDSNNNVIQTSRKTVSSGPPASNGHPPYPYLACNSSVQLTLVVPPNNGFLNHFGLDDNTSATAYYNAIGASSKPTLTAWKNANGFNTGSDTNAIYFNHGDLGFGRWMHVKKKVNGDIAYYVSNYPNQHFAAVARALNNPNFGLIATVAMEYSPGPIGGGRYTKFYVYDNAGNLTTSADLDGTVKFVPRLCIVCHGGSYTPPTPANQGNMGSRFLPFALESFNYSLPFLQATRAQQEPRFKILNSRIRETNMSAATDELICGWYGSTPANCTLPNATQNSAFVPTGWSAKPSLYSSVVQPSCRTCHISRNPGLDWANWSGFQSFGGAIKFDVCQSKVMPQAKRTYQNFWLSTTPHQPAALANAGLNGWAPNDPCPQ